MHPTATGATDDKILALLADYDASERGFRLLVDTYQERLYWHVRRLVTDHEDANDVVQNCLIKVYRNVHNFRGQSKLYTWLYRIATNEAITFLNRRKRQNITSIDEEENQVVNQLRADTFFDGDEAQLQLQAALTGLPEKQRLVFQLRYYEEMSYRDMSEVLDTSVGALKASYHHAVKKIEAHLLNAQL